MIFCSSCLPAAADAQFVECTSEQSHFIDGQPVFGLGLQEGENLHRGHPVSFLFIFGGMEVAEEELFQRCGLFKLPVGLFQDGFVGIVQPVAFTLHDVVHGLGIELAIIDSDVCLDRAGHFDANETAASRRVGQQVFQIAGPDEGGIAAHFLNSTTVGLSQVGNRFLQEVLQEALLIGVYLVEFVDVNQKKAAKAALRFLLALEVDTVGVAETQFRWQ